MDLLNKLTGIIHDRRKRETPPIVMADRGGGPVRTQPLVTVNNKIGPTGSNANAVMGEMCPLDDERRLR